MRISILGLIILVLALPCTAGDRRRLQNDGQSATSGARRVIAVGDRGDVRLKGNDSVLWSGRHDTVSNDTRNILLPAAAMAGPSSLGKKPGEKFALWIFRGIGVLSVVLMLCIVLGVWLQKRSGSHCYDSSCSGIVVTLVVLRGCGEALVTLQAKRHWSGRQVREEVSKHADDDEHVCQLVWDSPDGCDIALRDDQHLDDIVGLVDGCKLRAIMRRGCVVPSGVSLFVGARSVGASRQTARIWLYEDRSAFMTFCTHASRDGISKTTSMEGHLDGAGNLIFSSFGCKVIGLLQGAYGRQDITFPHAPMFGKLKLKQSLVEVVFKVSQSNVTPCNSCITFFDPGEVVLETSNDGGHRSVLTCLWWKREETHNGSTKISFSCVGDVNDWKENFDRGGAVVIKDFSGSWSGPIGKRKLLLFNFLSLGNVELVEHSIDPEVLGPEAFEC